MMETKTIRKRKTRNIILTILFNALSLALGFFIAYFGNKSSFIETWFIATVILLFGFILTFSGFVYQSLKDKESEATEKVISKFISALAKTLFLILVLIIIAIILDFVSTLQYRNDFLLIISTLKNAALIYAFICQIDILVSFIIIIKN